MADDAAIKDRATFTAMTEGTLDDWQAIARAGAEHLRAERLGPAFVTYMQTWKGFVAEPETELA